MYVVEVKVGAIRAGETPRFRLVLEDRRGTGWNRKEVIDGVALGEMRKFLLNDDERVVVELIEGERIIFDAAQNAAVPVANVEVGASGEGETAPPVSKPVEKNDGSREVLRKTTK
jgi:sugar phosphate isomerase/epimerase